MEEEKEAMVGEKRGCRHEWSKREGKEEREAEKSWEEKSRRKRGVGMR